MAGKREKKGSKGGVIVKKYEIVEGGHHGGAWKVAYADFVTAMMAFFLLMWLLNATTEDQRKGLADYFSPNNLMSHASSGTGQPFGGHTAFDQGALVSDRGSVQITVGKRPVIDRTEDGDDPVYADFHRARSGEGLGRGPMPDDQDADDSPDDKLLGQRGTHAAPGPGGPSEVMRDGQPDNRPVTPADVAAEKAREEKAAFETAAQQIRDAVRSDPALADLSKQLTIDMTPDGLRIQILDEVKLPMFPTGSSTPNDRAKLLLQKVVPVLMKLHQPISIAGHTDSAPFPGPGRTNWELSAERANATRRLLVDDGLPETRLKSVMPADPLAAANRRIAILVMREAPPPPITVRPPAAPAVGPSSAAPAAGSSSAAPAVGPSTPARQAPAPIPASAKS
jgi:chemotaxis protein MotB